MSDLGHAIVLKKGVAKGLRLRAVVASFNHAYTLRLLASASARLKALGGAFESVVWVPGALELPLACAWAAKEPGVDAVVALGCVIRGETSHYDLVCEGAQAGIQRVSLDSGVPVLFGVITVEDAKQALARCNGGPKDSGRHAAEAAVAMARLSPKRKGARHGR